jgi:phosphoribosylformimino-5-aminoimidazole carboxamide ribotide isomerase
VRRPDLVATVSDVVPVAVGLEHRDGELATDGWTEGSGVQLVDALDRFPTAAAFVITDISRDGMLQGPDTAGLAAAVDATSTPVIASGGVSSLADVAALAAIPGLAGVITGRAVYEGRFTVGDAVRALEVA